MQGTYGNGRLVTVFGGSGFVGRTIVRALAMRGYRVRAAVRRPDLAGFLRPLGMVGQVQAVQANLRYPESVAAALRGSVAAVNAVGVMVEQGRQTFDAVHVEGAAAIAAAARIEGLAALVHVSSLGIDGMTDSEYARTKREGEAAVFAANAGAVILRPSVQFGPGDSFFNRFARMATTGPVLPIVGPDAKFQPVFVGDVAEIAARAVDGRIRNGRIYELGGPEVLTFRRCMELMLEIIERRRRIVAIPFGIASIMGSVLGRLPGRLLTRDQVRQLRHDTIVSPEAIAEGRTLPGVCIEPASLAAILPTYLLPYRPAGQFARIRKVEQG
ncbi:MAG: complex I NDUFA9 subunit family protein [Bauldia sp.]|nr:complex I NDUFA9 subunit family protein [Bauldia sp.]